MTTIAIDEDFGERKRWSGALAIVLALHGAPLLIAAWWLGPMPPLTPPEPAILIDMAPPAAPPSPPSDQTPGPKQLKADAPRPVVKEAPPPIPSAARPEVALPERAPEPVERAAATPAPRTSAPPSRIAPASATASNTAADWRGLVLARLDRVKRYPAAAEIRRQQGVPYIRITMDRRGKVIGTRLERSSGIAALDREAVALPARAQPLPPVPAEIPGEPVELVAPVEFFLTR